MKCPTCTNQTLVITERQNIEIDYCPECRGVWLDRGELDKLIERTNTESHSSSRDDYKKDYHPYKKRKSFLSEIFD